MPRPDTTTPAWAKESLRAAGLRATAARIAVMRRLADLGKPQSHAEVVEFLADSGFDQSTLFRCLNELADAGLAVRLDLGDQVRRFELAKPDGAGEAEHAHFMCVDCGTLTCLEGFAFKVTPERGPRRKALGEITEVLLRGHCGTCLHS
ncbi:MAG: transcriptional repressor [Planctomycetota bacterium]